jgi:hypothetical protein
MNKRILPLFLLERMKKEKEPDIRAELTWKCC